MPEPFPRGGSLKLPKEAEPQQPKNKRRYSKLVNDESTNKRTRKSDHISDHETTRKVWNSRLTYETLTPGTLVLGAVRRIDDMFLLLELPDGLEGQVDAKTVSSRYTTAVRSNEDGVALLPEMYHEGQLLIASVIQIDSSVASQKVQLSIDPDVVNRGLRSTGLRAGMTVQSSIVSHEDKGYLLSVGLSSVKAFMPYDAAEDWTQKYLDGQRIPIGCSLTCWVQGNEGRVVKMGMEPGIFEQPSRDLLMPGMLLESFATPSSLASRENAPGLYVRFTKKATEANEATNPLIGFVARRRLPTPAESPEVYPDGAPLFTTVTYVKHNTALLGLSACVDLVDPQNMDTFLKGHEIGQLLEVESMHITASEGVFFKICGNEAGETVNSKKKRKKPTETRSVFAYAPRDRLQGENILEAYNPGTMHNARILGLSMLDRLLFVATKKDILKQKIVSAQSAQIGMKIKATITVVAKEALFGKIYNHINCVIERLHTADTPPAQLDTRFAVGGKVTGRVLSVDLHRNRVQLTLKPSLVNSDLGIVDSYDPKYEGNLAEGVVVFMSPKGLLVQFFAGVKGWLSKTEMGPGSEGAYQVGQLLRVRIVSVNAETERMSLSTNLSPEEVEITAKPSFNEPVKSGVEGFTLDRSFDVKILEKTKGTGFHVKILGQKSSVKDFPCFLPTGHLADSTSVAALLEDSYNVRDVISNCVFFANGPKPTVTAKFSVARALLSGRLPKSFEAVEERRAVTGVISRKHPDFGFFLDFPGNLSALLPFSNLEYGTTDEGNVSEEGKSSKQIKLLDNHPSFAINQTIDTMTYSVNLEKRKFAVTAKRASCLPRSLNESVECLANDLRLLERVKIWAGKSADIKLRALSEVTIGACMETKIKAKKSIIDTAQSDKVICLGTLVNNANVDVITTRECEMGEVDGTIIDIDWSGKRIIVEPDLERSEARKSANCELGIAVKAKILHVTEIYGIVAIFLSEDAGGFENLAYVPSQLFHGDVREMSELRAQVGKFSWIVPRKIVGNNVILANLEENEKKIGWLLSPKLEPGVSTEQVPTSKSKLLKTQVHIAPGAIYDAQVTEIEPDRLKILIGGYHSGTVHATEIDVAGPLPHFPTQGYKVGQIVKVRVLSMSKMGHTSQRKFCVCTLRKSKMHNKRSKRRENLKLKTEFSVHERILVAIKSRSAKFLEVSPNSLWRARIPVSNVETALDQGVLTENDLLPGSVVSAFVNEVIPSKKQLVLNFLSPKHESGHAICEATVSGLENWNEGGDLIDKLSITLSDGSHGVCYLPDICDNYDKVKSVLERLRSNPVTQCKPYAVVKGTTVVTLRKSVLKPETGKVRDPWIQSPGSLEMGKTYRGFVTSSHISGVYVRLGASVVGKVPMGETSEYFVKDPAAAFPLGKLLTVLVVRSGAKRSERSATSRGSASLDSAKEAPHTLLLSMLPDKTGIPDQLPESQRLRPRKRELGKRARTVSGDSGAGSVGSEEAREKRPRLESVDSGEERESSESELSNDDDAESTVPPKHSTASQPGMLALPEEGERLNLVPTRFSALNLMNIGLQVEKKTEKEKEKEKEDEPTSDKLPEAPPKREPLPNPLATPASLAFHERIQSNPQDPEAWLEFMQHWQSVGEAEKAKAIGRRALEAIDLRKESARFTIWKSLLRLELEAGTPTSVKEVFEEAARRNDELKTYREMASLYVEFGMRKEADEVYEAMLKKFKDERVVYEWAVEHWMECGQEELARQTLQRGLKFLPKSEHVQLIVHSARLEFSVGDKERGKTLFEGLVNAYPKRNDLWSVYADMMLKFCSVELARAVFERVLLMKLTARQVKFYFTKWMEMEAKHGDAKSVDYVKQKALDVAETL